MRWQDVPKPFLEHLEELRRTILGSAGLLIAGMALAFPLTPWILKCLRAPLYAITTRPEIFLRSLEIGGAFSIATRVSFWSGLIFAAPGMLVLWARFIFPGLRRVERRALAGAATCGLLLFLCGIVMGYFLVLPNALKILFGMHAWLGIQAEWTITSYIAFAVQLLLAFGAAFELPVLLAALGWLGVVDSAFLRKYRRHAIVGIFILAAILTPPDVVSQILLALPMLILYELCVFLVSRMETGKARAGEVKAPNAANI